MITIAKIQIRSTNKKHLWKISDKTVFEMCIDNLHKTGLIDYIFVWIDDYKTLPIADNDATIVCCDRPKDMLHYGNSLRIITEWHNAFNQNIIDYLGGKYRDIAIVFHININLALISPYTYQVMYNRLMEDDKANSIFPVVKIKPHLFMENPNTKFLFPIWSMPALDRQKYPQLYRRLGSWVEHVKRPKIAGGDRALWFQIPHTEAIDIENTTDLEMAKYFYRYTSNTDDYKTIIDHTLDKP